MTHVQRSGRSHLLRLASVAAVAAVPMAGLRG